MTSDGATLRWLMQHPLARGAITIEALYEALRDIERRGEERDRRPPFSHSEDREAASARR